MRNEYKELFKTIITIALSIIIMTIGWLFLVISIPFIWNKWYNKRVYDPITDRLDTMFMSFES